VRLLFAPKAGRIEDCGAGVQAGEKMTKSSFVVTNCTGHGAEFFGGGLEDSELEAPFYN